MASRTQGLKLPVVRIALDAEKVMHDVSDRRVVAMPVERVGAQRLAE